MPSNKISPRRRDFLCRIALHSRIIWMLDVLRVTIRPNTVRLVATPKNAFSHRSPGASGILLKSPLSHHKSAIDPESGRQIPLNFEVESASHGNDARSEVVFAANCARRVCDRPDVKIFGC
jgi:hypothetical protein